MLSEEEKREIEQEITHYPVREGACIDALKIVQGHRKWISDESLRDIAHFLEMSPHELDGVATFYNLIFRKPVGDHIILLCDSVSCWICGCDSIRQQINRHLGIDYGETTADDLFTLLPIPCLGTCDHAPALMVDDDLYLDLTPDKVAGILDAYHSREKSRGKAAH